MKKYLVPSARNVDNPADFSSEVAMGARKTKTFSLKPFFLVCLFLIAFLSGCQQANDGNSNLDQTQPVEMASTAENATSIPTLTPSADQTETLISPTLTTTVTATPKRTTAPPMLQGGYAGLSDGEYLLLLTQNGLEVISIQERAQYKLLNIISGSVNLSQDQRQLVVFTMNFQKVKLINLDTMVEEELPFLIDCFEAVLSADGTTFLAVCPSSMFLEVYSISRDGKKAVQLTKCFADWGDCKAIAYSPDGQWITYDWVYSSEGQSSKVGLYLTKSTCQDMAYQCEEMAFGPFEVRHNYGWAPNSQYLAGSGPRGMTLYEVKDNEIKEVRDIEAPTNDIRNDIFWSPDSSRIAYSVWNEIWLVDVAEGAPELFKEFDYDINLVGWVNIKDGKVSP